MKPDTENKAAGSRPAAPTCSACGVPWVDHLGIIGTCRKLEDARSALNVIHTWASFQNGRALNCKDVIRLTRRVLDDTEPNDPHQARAIASRFEGGCSQDEFKKEG